MLVPKPIDYTNHGFLSSGLSPDRFPFFFEGATVPAILGMLSVQPWKEEEMEQGNSERLKAALSLWYESLESGNTPDIQEICGHDSTLIKQLRAATDSEQILIDKLQGRGFHTKQELPAENLGEYRLRHAIGSGGTGQVFLAEQTTLGRTVALKVLDRRTMGDPKSMLRFRREAEIAAALDHPNIVPIYGIGEDKGYFFIAMKWLTGPSLDAPGLSLSSIEVAEIGKTVASCLAEAHACGVVHRDIKPANIVLDSGKAFVVDFGLARASSDQTLTQEGVVAGTLPYLAPEQIELKTSGQDPRTDIYALGATLYTLCAGKLPFEDDDQRRLARKIVISDPAPLSGTERDLETIIFKALEKEPSARYRTAGEMAKELDRFARGEPISTRSIGPISRVLRSIRRRKALAVSLVAMFSVIVVLGSLWLVKLREDSILFRSELGRVERALRRGEISNASKILDPLLRRSPKDSFALGLRDSIAAQRAFDRLLDLVVDPPSASNAPGFERALAACREHHARALNPALFDQALLFARYLQGKYEDAKEEYALMQDVPSSKNSRVMKILGFLINEQPLPEDLESVSNSADESVLCAIGLRLKNRPNREVISELENAKRLEPGHRRTILLQGILLFDAGRYQTADDLFYSLTGYDVVSPLVYRSRAHVQVFLDKPDEAEESLSMLDDDRDSRFYLIKSLIARNRNDIAGEEKWLRDGLLIWNRNAILSRNLASVLLARGEEDESLRIQTQARPSPRGSNNWQLDQTTRFIGKFTRIANEEARGEMQALNQEQTDALTKLDLEVETLFPALTYHYAIAEALWVKAWISLQQGDVEGALINLRTAVKSSPWLGPSRVYFATVVFNSLVQSESHVGEAKTIEFLKEARAMIDLLVEQEGKGEDPPNKRIMANMTFVGALIAYKLGDEADALEAAFSARLRQGPGNEVQLRYLDNVIEILKKRQGN